MTWFLLGLAVLIGLWALLEWGTKASPRDLLKTLKWVALGVGGGILLLVLLTKNISLIWTLAFVALPWLNRLRMIRNLWKGMRGPSPGRRSEISCRYFDMTLDHDSGTMDGRIKEGPYAGALLSELTMEEGQELFQDVRSSGDDRSRRLLEAYLDRTFGADWRTGQDHGTDNANKDGRRSSTGDGSGPMTEAEALSMLGLEPDATSEDVKAAHRRLMKQVHPDAGGSDYLAARVNEAKDLLLRKRG
jgi:hypothetical protein